jgi:hypothetical protein
MDIAILMITILSLLLVAIAYILIKHHVRKYARTKQNYLPLIFLNTLEYYIVALFIVVLSAKIGPYTIEHLTSYKITAPNEMTASEATYYTLQALIAVVIGSYIAKIKQ